MRVAFGILILVLVALPALFWLSAELSLDRERAHARATASLPRFGPGLKSGLVRIVVGDLEFRARVAGFDSDGPGLVLLHGFPESSIMWQPLLERAAEAGYRVVAFDQRGYSPGARPENVAAYAVPELVDDMLGVATAVGFEEFHLVGHDWGSIVGWSAAASNPERVLSWTSLSIPHPGAIPDPARADERPTYISVFRMKGVAEALLGAFGRLPMRRGLYATMSPGHRAEYEALFSEPGALTAALNWYRALPEGGFAEGADQAVSRPVLYVYGRRDMKAFVGPAVQTRLLDFVDGPFERVALDAGHWLIQDEEEAVVEAVLRHLEGVRLAR